MGWGLLLSEEGFFGGKGHENGQAAINCEIYFKAVSRSIVCHCCQPPFSKSKLGNFECIKESFANPNTFNYYFRENPIRATTKPLLFPLSKFALYVNFTTKFTPLIYEILRIVRRLYIAATRHLLWRRLHSFSWWACRNYLNWIISQLFTSVGLWNY